MNPSPDTEQYRELLELETLALKHPVVGESLKRRMHLTPDNLTPLPYTTAWNRLIAPLIPPDTSEEARNRMFEEVERACKVGRKGGSSANVRSYGDLNIDLTVYASMRVDFYVPVRVNRYISLDMEDLNTVPDEIQELVLSAEEEAGGELSSSVLQDLVYDYISDKGYSDLEDIFGDCLDDLLVDPDTIEEAIRNGLGDAIIEASIRDYDDYDLEIS